MAELESLFKQNELDKLEKKIGKLIYTYPKIPILYNILGVVFQKKNNIDQAILNFKKAIDLKPKFEQALNNLGNVLQSKRNFNEAIKNYKIAIKNNPNYAEAYSNLGNALAELGRFEEAANNQKHAIKLNPNHAEFYTNLGSSLVELGKIEEAIINHKKAIKINPNYAEAYSNLGNALADLGKFEEAVKNHQYSIKLNPKYTRAILNESFLRLALGEFEVGWEMFESRLDPQNTTIPMKSYESEKTWKGNYLDGTLLVWGEEGIGDHIIFGSMISDLKRYAKNIILEIDQRLVNLFSRYFEKINFLNIKVIGMQEKLVSNFDKHISIGSLGQYLRKSKKSFESSPEKFLISPHEKESELKKKFFQNDKFKIGISWKTLNPKQQYRNINLKEMLPILSNPKCEFINLQYGKSEEDLKFIEAKFGIKIKTINEVDNYNDIDRYSALINCLDLVITIQNSTAHIASALGKKTFVTVSRLGTPKWHWHADKKKSLWYPSLTIFLQGKIGNWDNVIADINNDLNKLISDID